MLLQSGDLLLALLVISDPEVITNVGIKLHRHRLLGLF